MLTELKIEFYIKLRLNIVLKFDVWNNEITWKQDKITKDKNGENCEIVENCWTWVLYNN